MTEGMSCSGERCVVAVPVESTVLCSCCQHRLCVVCAQSLCPNHEFESHGQNEHRKALGEVDRQMTEVAEKMTGMTERMEEVMEKMAVVVNRTEACDHWLKQLVGKREQLERRMERLQRERPSAEVTAEVEAVKERLDTLASYALPALERTLVQIDQSFSH